MENKMNKIYCRQHFIDWDSVGGQETWLKVL